MNQNIKDFMPSIKIELCENSSYITLYTREILIEKNKWFGTEYHLFSGPDCVDVNYITQTIINELHKIDGVKNVSVHPYELLIIKADAYTWDELYPKIKLVLAKYLPVEHNCFVTR